MVDWMIEVVTVYDCHDKTYFLAVYIMDKFLQLSKKEMKNEDVHLLGMVSLFIASKFEDVIPIHLAHMEKKVGHGLFKTKHYKDLEILMITTIGLDNLITTTLYDMIKTYFFDFIFNNADNIHKFDMLQIIYNLEKMSISRAKLTLHFSEFYDKS